MRCRTSRTERQAYDLVAQGFGPGSNGPLVIAVDIAGDPTVVDPLVDAVSADPGIASVRAAAGERRRRRGVADRRSRRPAPQDAATLDTIERLRADVLPGVLAGSPAQAHVGGQTANFADVGATVNDRLPVFIAAVLALSFLLLMLVFRSVLVPLKAVAAQPAQHRCGLRRHGHGVPVGLGRRASSGSSRPCRSSPFIPMFMFAILFGLSMDYEVFLLSRVREEYVATRRQPGVGRRRHRQHRRGSSRRRRSS